MILGNAVLSVLVLPLVGRNKTNGVPFSCMSALRKYGCFCCTIIGSYTKYENINNFLKYGWIKFQNMCHFRFFVKKMC